MSDSDKTRAELLTELESLRQRNTELEETAARCRQMEAAALIAETMLEAACVHDLDSTIRQVNEEFERTSGWTRGEAVGRTPVELGLTTRGEWLKLEREAVPKLIKEGFVRNIEIISIRRDGSEFSGLMSWTLVRDGEGRPAGIVSVMRDITDRKQAEESLIDSQEMLKEAYRMARMGRWDLDHHNGSLRWTDSVVDIFEMDPGRSGDSYAAFLGAVHPDDRDMIDKAWRKSLEEKAPYVMEHRLLMEDGRVKWVRAQWRTDHDEEGRATVSVGIVQDITDRKRVEVALQESQEKYRDLVENLNEVVYALDDKAVITYVSPSVERAGYRPDELVGKPYIDFVHPDDKEGRIEQYQRILAGIHEPSEYRFLARDGSSLWVRTNGRAVFRDGRVIGVHGTLVDITDYKLADEMLRQSEKRYRLLAENTTDIIWSMDMDLKPTYISPSVEWESGFSVEEALSFPLDRLYTPDSIETMIGAYAEEMALEETGPKGRHVSRTLELQGYRRDGSTTWIEVHLTLTRDKDGKATGIQGVTRNISERKRAEEKLQEAYAREMTAHKQLQTEMKTRVEFTRALVHELKTPVTAMMASNTLLVEELPHGPLLKLAANVQQSIANLDKRISELLDIARGELGLLKLELRESNPLKILHEAAAEMEATITSQGQALVTALPRALPLAWIDQNRFHQVILNLLGNASKFSPEGTVVTLRARKNDHNLIVEVKDNGPGMDRKHTERIFEPYYRVESDGQRLPGLGLGLALCKRTIEEHGGKIWVKTRKGKGSIFAFSIPLIPAPPG